MAAKSKQESQESFDDELIKTVSEFENLSEQDKQAFRELGGTVCNDPQ